MIWKPGDCYTMTVPLHTAGLLSPKCRVDAGLGAGRQPDWILDRICGKKIVLAPSWLPESQPLRGGTLRQAGQIGRLKLSGHRGPLHLEFYIGPQRTAHVLNMDRLQLALEIVEGALAEAGRIMSTKHKARLVLAAYDLIEDGSDAENSARVIRLIRATG